MSFKDQVEGFPFGQMAVVSAMRFAEPLAFTSLFPYLYFMIRDFCVAPTESDISKYSGYMASSFAFCQFLFAVQWGKISDRIGRKPVLLLGLMGTSVCLLVFGFSKSYFTAFAARAIAGAINGNVSVLRTTIGEICVEKRHQALGFSTLPLFFNLGAVLGPLIGGCPFFTEPPKKSPYDYQDAAFTAASGLAKFRAQHPYALSNIVVTSVLWLSWIIGFLFLEETNDNFKNRRDIGLEIGDFVLRLVGYKVPPRNWRKVTSDEETPILAVSSRSSEVSVASADDSSEVTSNIVGTRYSQGQYYESSKTPTEKESRLTKRAMGAILSNSIISLHNVSYNEFLPVFLAARLRKEELLFPLKIVGGFGLDTSTIGTLFSSTGIVGILIIFLIFPWIDRNLGTLQGYKFSLLIFPIVYLLVPMAVFTVHSYNPQFPEWLTVFCLYLLVSLKTLAQSTGLPQVMILTHRAAAKPYRAYVNSVNMSMVALSRCLGPIAFGYIMTFGDLYKVAWLMWWVMALLALIGFFQAYTLSDHDDSLDI